MDQKLHENHVFLMIFGGGLTTVWSKMLRLYWHARHSMSNYRSNLKKNQSFHTQGHHLKVPEWIKNCALTEIENLNFHNLRRESARKDAIRLF